MKPVAEILADIKKKRILVIGDTIVDISTMVSPLKKDDLCDKVAKKIPFDPRRQLYDKVSFGGAACVARNAAALGAQVDFVTLIGSGDGQLAMWNWAPQNIRVHYVVDASRPVTVKHRYYWEDGKQAFRVDTFDNTPVSGKVETEIACDIQDLSETADVIAVADYRHGMMTEELARCAVEPVNYGKPVFVASQVSQSESNHHWYNYPAHLVMNGHEYDSLPVKRGKCTVTRGADGCEEHTATSVKIVSGIKADALDPTGAGDAFLAAYALTKSPEFANVWAGLSCEVMGANPPKLDRLIEWEWMKECA